MSLKLINNNAYRYLGVFANASKKDIERNKSKFNAFLRVNKPVPKQPLDSFGLLYDIQRNLENVSKAESDISISQGQLTHGMFWFVCVDDNDEECFRLLVSGDMDDAINKWKHYGAIHSMQNILICLLCRQKYREAIVLAHNLYTLHFQEWKELFSFLNDISSAHVTHTFLDCLYTEAPKMICSMSWAGLPQEWATYIKQKAVTPIVDKLTQLIQECKNSNQENPKEHYKDGFALFNDALPLLTELESILTSEDITLQSMEDKVYTEILNCSIESYNAVHDDLNTGNDAPYRQIAPLCNELTNKINSQYVSPAVAKRIEENKEVINKSCSNIEKTIEESLAFNNQICWFCGAHGKTSKIERTYSYSVSKPTLAGTETTTYSKKVPINVCDKCLHEIGERDKWELYSATMIFVVTATIILLFFDFWLDFIFWGWVFTGAAVVIGSYIVGCRISKWVRKGFDKQNIRVFKRDVDDHPLVKYVKSQGYH